MVPAIDDLRTLNGGGQDAAIDEDAFPNHGLNLFWSSSNPAYAADYTWVVDFYVGSDGTAYENYDGRVRLVRSGQ